MERRPPFQLILTFFGLTLDNIPKYRLNLFNQIHDIVILGRGGYDFYTVYNFPIWLRNTTYHRLKEENNQFLSNSPNQTNLINPDGTIDKEKFKTISQEYKGKTNYK